MNRSLHYLLFFLFFFPPCVPLQPAWRGVPSPAAWPPPSPPSTPTPRRWSSSDTSASCLSRASARSRTTWTRRRSTTSGTAPSSPSPAPWRSTPATAAPEPGSSLWARFPVRVPDEGRWGARWPPWTWGRTRTRWGRSGAENPWTGSSTEHEKHGGPYFLFREKLITCGGETESPKLITRRIFSLYINCKPI